MLKDGPDDLIEKKIKIRWAKDAEAATPVLREGEVLVVMQRSDHHEENVAHALMAYLPKALLPRARRYLDHERMRAADLIVAKSVLAEEREVRRARCRSSSRRTWTRHARTTRT